MSAFWDWAVAAYGGAGVAEACLALQDDHDQCVPLLLWAAWRATQGVATPEVMAAKATGVARAWSVTAIAPLREIRRRLKTALSDDDDSVRLPLREQVKAVELAAERALMTVLAALPAVSGGQEVSPEDLCREGLDACAHAWGEKMPPLARDRLLRALTKGDFLRYDARARPG